MIHLVCHVWDDGYAGYFIWDGGRSVSYNTGREVALWRLGQLAGMGEAEAGSLLDAMADAARRSR